jgi:hypothetical protein
MLFKQFGENVILCEFDPLYCLQLYIVEQNRIPSPQMEQEYGNRKGKREVFTRGIPQEKQESNN